MAVNDEEALRCLCRIAAATDDPVLGRLALELLPSELPLDDFHLVIETHDDEDCE